MGLLELIITVVVVGVILWVVESFIPMDASIKKLLQVIVIIIVAIWLLQSFGLIGHIGNGNVNDIRIK